MSFWGRLWEPHVYPQPRPPDAAQEWREIDRAAELVMSTRRHRQLLDAQRAMRRRLWNARMRNHGLDD